MLGKVLELVLLRIDHFFRLMNIWLCVSALLDFGFLVFDIRKLCLRFLTYGSYHTSYADMSNNVYVVLTV